MSDVEALLGGDEPEEGDHVTTAWKQAEEADTSDEEVNTTFPY